MTFLAERNTKSWKNGKIDPILSWKNGRIVNIILGKVAELTYFCHRKMAILML